MDARLLARLKAGADHFLSGEELSRSLQVTRAAIWKQIEVLRAHGYEIEAQPHLGYRLVQAPDRLIDVEIQSGLQTQTFGRQLQCFETTDSTMDIAHRWAQSHAPEGAVVLAERQRHGRGRLGRTWVSPKGAGIYASLIVRPALPVRTVSAITLAMAIGLARGIEEDTELPVQIKWPNDLMLQDAKVGGILTEMQAEQDRLQYVITGFGINVNTSPRDLPAGAISLRRALGRPIRRVALLQSMLQHAEATYRQLLDDGFSALRQAWRARANLLGHRVRVVSQHGPRDHAMREIEGQAIDIDEEGALVIRHDTGVQERVVAGDVVKLW